VKSLVELLELLVLDCARKSGAALSRDVVTLRDRVSHEGDSFITITLPAFCADFEKSLALGRVAPGAWLSFGKQSSGVPASAGTPALRVRQGWQLTALPLDGLHSTREANMPFREEDPAALLGRASPGRRREVLSVRR